MTQTLRLWITAGIVLLTVAMFGELTAAPIEERRGDVVLVHGGVGAEERAAIEARAADFNLHLTFARKGSGAYLSEVKVVVRNRQGTVVVDTVASGPRLLARLPDGEYTVSATERDTTLTQAISIKGATRRAWVFRFDLPQGAAPEFDAGK